MDTNQASRHAAIDRVETAPTARSRPAPALRDIPRSAPAGFDLEALRMLVLDLQQKLAALDARTGALHGMQTRTYDQALERIEWLEQQVASLSATVDELCDADRLERARPLAPPQD